MTNFIPDIKPYPITLNQNNECMSIRCDFYQTCNKNSLSKFYKTQQKFDPSLTNTNQCLSFGSGKRSEIKDNNYPHSLKSFIKIDS